LCPQISIVLVNKNRYKFDDVEDDTETGMTFDTKGDFLSLLDRKERKEKKVEQI
jgi:hypothetical protein